MDWNALTIETSSEAVDAVSNMLMTAGAEGVAIDDAADYQQELKTATGEWLDPQTIPHRQSGAAVTGYFAPSHNLVELQTELAAKVAQLPSFGLAKGTGKITLAAVREKDWANTWKQYYHPVRVTRYLTVVPQWLDYSPSQPGELLITLDPGMAFGTGTHPTTQLMLQLLEQAVRGGETVIDVGTGSGVLAIAATKLGSGLVLATDVDAVAVANAQANIALNPGVAVTVQASDLLTDVTTQADLVLANILAEVLVPLIPQVPAHLTAHGRLLLSGIFYDKIDLIRATLQDNGFQVDETARLGDWYGVAASLQKPVSE